LINQICFLITQNAISSVIFQTKNKATTITVITINTRKNQPGGWFIWKEISRYKKGG